MSRPPRWRCDVALMYASSIKIIGFCIILQSRKVCWIQQATIAKFRQLTLLYKPKSHCALRQLLFVHIYLDFAPWNGAHKLAAEVNLWWCDSSVPHGKATICIFRILYATLLTYPLLSFSIFDTRCKGRKRKRSQNSGSGVQFTIFKNFLKHGRKS